MRKTLTPEELKEETEICKGITSKVNSGDNIAITSQRQLLMLDLDDVTKDRAVQIAENLIDGLYIVQRSSENSRNIISLSLHYWSDIIRAKAEVPEDDAQHLKIGIQRQKWITRLSEKGDKPRPEFEALVDSRDNKSAIVDVSSSHIELFTGLYDGLYDVMPELSNFNVLASPTVEAVRYPTLAESEVSLNE